MNTNSPTPRTDAKAKIHLGQGGVSTAFVTADFARTLERELAEAKKEVTRLNKACDEYSNDEILGVSYKQERDHWKERWTNEHNSICAIGNALWRDNKDGYDHHPVAIETIKALQERDQLKQANSVATRALNRLLVWVKQDPTQPYGIEARAWVGSTILVGLGNEKTEYHSLPAAITELDQTKQQLTELAANEARLRKTIEGMLENYIQLKLITLAMARSDSPSWIGSRMTPDDDVHVIAVRQALSSPPSDALKPWVEFVEDAEKSYIFQTKARELLKSIGQ